MEDIEETWSPFCSIEGPSNQSPPAHATSTPRSVDNSLEMERLFGKRFIPTDEIKEQLAFLRSTKPSEMQEITGAIRDLLTKFTTGQPNIPMSKEEANTIESSVKEIVSFALSSTLTQKEIVNRSKALGHMIVELMAHVPLKNEWYKMCEAGSWMTEDDKLLEEVLAVPSTIISLVSRLLKFNSSDIEQRTNAIVRDIDFLLPPKDNQSRNTPMISFLMNLRTEEIVKRGTSMRRLLSFEKQRGLCSKWTPELTPLKVAASHLSTDELTSRVDSATLILTSSPDLEPITKQLLYLSLKLEAVGFDSYFNLTKENQDLLVPWFSTQAYDSPIFNLSFGEIKRRVSTIKLHKDLLDKAAKDGSSRLQTAVRFMDLSAPEIYGTAKQQHCKDYFENDFLSKMGDEFRKRNESSLTNQELSEILLGRDLQLLDFSSEAIQPRIQRFGKVYENLFQPPSFPEFQSSGDIASGPASSSASSSSSSSS